MKTLAIVVALGVLSGCSQVTPRSEPAQPMTPKPIPATVLAAINALNLPKAPKALTHIVEVHETNARALQNDLFFTAEAASGQLRTRIVSPYSTSYTTSMRGLVPLTFQGQYRDDGVLTYAASNVEQLSFSGDWKQMPVGATLGFSLNERNRSSTGADRMIARDNTCVVIAEVPASTVNADLSGNAKALDCKAVSAKYSTTTSVFYLVDYGYFFTSLRATGGLREIRQTLIKAE